MYFFKLLTTLNDGMLSSRHVAFLESASQAENEIKTLFVTYSHVHNYAVCNLQKMRTVTQKFTLSC